MLLMLDRVRWALVRYYADIRCCAMRGDIRALPLRLMLAVKMALMPPDIQSRAREYVAVYEDVDTLLSQTAATAPS